MKSVTVKIWFNGDIGDASIEANREYNLDTIKAAINAAIKEIKKALKIEAIENIIATETTEDSAVVYIRL